MMEMVTDEAEGTAPLAKVAGYRVAGKTGTAQVGRERQLLQRTSSSISFAGFAPADDPRFTVYVVIHNPEGDVGGGGTGGPAFRKIMAYLLQRYAVRAVRRTPRRSCPSSGSRAPVAGAEHAAAAGVLEARPLVDSRRDCDPPRGPAPDPAGRGRPPARASRPPRRPSRRTGPTRSSPGVTMNSRLVQPGDLYVASPGRQHPRRPLRRRRGGGRCRRGAHRRRRARPSAARTGLALPVLVVERPRVGASAPSPPGCTATRPSGWRWSAVTGTQGKTTTTRLAEAALEVAGVPAGVVGTIGTRVAGEAVTSSLTTPEAPDLHALLAVMVERGVRCCAMEVSSHALVMGRVDGVVFDVAAFTNLGRDHLDFHADVEDYFAAKASLFTPERARRGLVNVDDEHGRRLLARGHASR